MAVASTSQCLMTSRGRLLWLYRNLQENSPLWLKSCYCMSFTFKSSSHWIIKAKSVTLKLRFKLRLSLTVYWYWHNRLLNKNATQYDLLKDVRVAYLVQAFVADAISALIYYHYKSFHHLASQTQHQALTSCFMKLLFVQCHKIQRVCSHIIQMLECSKYTLSKRYSYQGMRH